MRIGTIGLAAAAALLATAAATAGEMQPMGGQDAAAAIKARQDGMKMSGQLFRGIRGAAQAGGDVSAQAGPADELAAWAKKLPTLFPAGSDTGDSKALPTVWTDRAGFDAKAAAFIDATTKLAAAAHANDAAAFSAAAGALGGTCQGCHQGYRPAPPPRPAAPPPAPPAGG